MNNDLISREDLIKALDALCDIVCEYSKKQRFAMCGACHLGSAFDVIDQLRSVQPERKKGHWIAIDGNRAICSECGAHWEFWSVMNYCPTCGAIII